MGSPLEPPQFLVVYANLSEYSHFISKVFPLSFSFSYAGDKEVLLIFSFLFCIISSQGHCVLCCGKKTGLMLNWFSFKSFKNILIISLTHWKKDETTTNAITISIFLKSCYISLFYFVKTLKNPSLKICSNKIFS